MAGRGRRPCLLEAMLRVHLMQNWFALSDPTMGEALYEIASLRNFAGLSLRNLQCARGCQMQRLGEDIAEKLGYEPDVFTAERQWRHTSSRRGPRHGRIAGAGAGGQVRRPPAAVSPGMRLRAQLGAAHEDAFGRTSQTRRRRLASMVDRQEATVTRGVGTAKAIAHGLRCSDGRSAFLCSGAPACRSRSPEPQTHAPLRSRMMRNASFR